MDHFEYGRWQWKKTLQCNVVFHWLTSMITIKSVLWHSSESNFTTCTQETYVTVISPRVHWLDKFSSIPCCRCLTILVFDHGNWTKWDEPRHPQGEDNLMGRPFGWVLSTRSSIGPYHRRGWTSAPHIKIPAGKSFQQIPSDVHGPRRRAVWHLVIAWDRPARCHWIPALVVTVRDISIIRLGWALYGPLTRYAKLRVRMRRECRERFPRHRR